MHKHKAGMGQTKMNVAWWELYSRIITGTLHVKKFKK